MITSAQNKKVKWIIQLNKKAAQRKKEGLFIAEGIKMFQEAPRNLLQEVYISECFLQEAKEKNAALFSLVSQKLEAVGYETVTEEVFEKMSDTQTPQGILCVLRQPTYSFENMLKAEEKPLFLMLENLQDPGNLGTIMRTGEGAGVTGVIMSRDTVDIYNPKTIRSTMGSVYRIPFIYVDDLLLIINELKQKDIGVYAAHLKGTRSYDEGDYLKGTAFLIGNEGNGLSDQAAAAADNYVLIPMKGQVESLNAAVASSLLMYEAARQRRNECKVAQKRGD